MHLKVCKQDKVCAKEQARARDLWDKQAWSKDLKESCRKQYTEPSWKDYAGAVNCISQLEKARQDFRLMEAEKRKREKTSILAELGRVSVQ